MQVLCEQGIERRSNLYQMRKGSRSKDMCWSVWNVVWNEWPGCGLELQLSEGSVIALRWMKVIRFLCCGWDYTSEKSKRKLWILATFRITNQYSREEIWDLIENRESQSLCEQGLMQRKVQNQRGLRRFSRFSPCMKEALSHSLPVAGIGVVQPLGKWWGQPGGPTSGHTSGQWCDSGFRTH